jgi:hypothetical protein
MGDDTVGDNGGEAWDEDASSPVDSCLAFEVPKVKGWYSGILMFFFLKVH